MDDAERRLQKVIDDCDAEIKTCDGALERGDNPRLEAHYRNRHARAERLRRLTQNALDRYRRYKERER